jgi:hypothetical protein
MGEHRHPKTAKAVRSWPSVFALVALGMLALETTAAVVVANQYETLACEGVNEPPWIRWFVLLVVATPILVPVSIGFIWGCAVRRDRAWLLWIAVAVGSIVPLAVFIATNPFCPS